MVLVNSDYLRSGLQFVKPKFGSKFNYQGPSNRQSKYTRLDNFYNKGLKNMIPITPSVPTQKNPPMSLDTKIVRENYGTYSYNVIRDLLDSIADCDTCKRRFYKRRAEKKELQNTVYI